MSCCRAPCRARTRRGYAGCASASTAVRIAARFPAGTTSARPIDRRGNPSMTLMKFGGPLLLMVCIAVAAHAAQLPDSTYDIHVAHPAFTTHHPVLLIDGAHHNFNTSEGLYRMFAKLAEADGFRVVANAQKFSAATLAGKDVLVIANAMGAAGLLDPNVEKPAFTAPESDAVRDWVQAGGSLLLIADHTPMGAAASGLARRFGVDMSNGYLADGSMADRSRGASTLVFTRDNAGIGDHPITRGRDSA